MIEPHSERSPRRYSTLCFVRHGQTKDNAHGVLQGSTGGALSELGMLQAKDLGKRLEKIKYGAVYCSELTRAVQTAALLTGGTPSRRVVMTSALNEQCYGVLEGKPLFRVLRLMKREGADFSTFNPPGGEPATDFCRRIRQFIESVLLRHRGERVLLITHYGVINTAVKLLLPEDDPNVRTLALENAAVVEVLVSRFGDGRLNSAIGGQHG